MVQRKHTWTRRSAALVASLAVVCASAPRLHAHAGPPFPVIVDRPVGPYVVSVWTDPDIGTGTFFVIFEARDDREPPPLDRVRIGVQPESGRLDEVFVDAEPQRVRHGARYYAEVGFDRQEDWRVRVVIAGRDGGGEIETRVEPTPDGTIGPIGLLVYAVPFLAVGFLWFKAALRRRQVV